MRWCTSKYDLKFNIYKANNHKENGYYCSETHKTHSIIYT